MFKTDLVRAVSNKTRLSQRLVNEVLSEALTAISDSLSRGQSVTLPGFGTFYTRQHAGGTVRHIRTHAIITVEPRRQAAFRAGEVLRQAARTEKARRGRPIRVVEGTSA